MTMRSRVLISALVLVVLSTASAVAIDFGGTLGNTTEASVPFDGDTSIGQGNRLSLFVRHSFSEELEVVARARYEYRLDTVFADETDTEVDWWQGDLDALYARARLPVEDGNGALVDLQAGRFRQREFSGALLSERADGLRATFQTADGEVTLGAGYTGFLMKESSGLLLSGADVSDDADDDEFFAPPRLLGIIAFSLPELVGRQNFDVSFIGQGDLRDEDDLPEGQGLVHTAYLGAGVSGPIVPMLFYDLYGYFGGGKTLTDLGGFYSYKPIQSYMIGANLQYFMPEVQQSVVSFGYLYSSGDKDHGSFYEGNTEGASKMFVGLTSPGFGAVFSPKLGNLMVTDLSYSVKPFSGQGSRALEEFQTELSVLGFFRPTTGVISEPGINPASDDLYLGTEVDLALNFRPFSDLGFSLVNGVFFPNNGSSDSAFLEDAVSSEYKATFLATFSF
jgi:hypothetical protein